MLAYPSDTAAHRVVPAARHGFELGPSVDATVSAWSSEYGERLGALEPTDHRTVLPEQGVAGESFEHDLPVTHHGELVRTAVDPDPRTTVDHDLDHVGAGADRLRDHAVVEGSVDDRQQHGAPVGGHELVLPRAGERHRCIDRRHGVGHREIGAPLDLDAVEPEPVGEGAA